MATSSIFAKVRISDPKKAEAFIDALEASENKPKRKSSIPFSVCRCRQDDHTCSSKKFISHNYFDQKRTSVHRQYISFLS